MNQLNIATVSYPLRNYQKSIVRQLVDFDYRCPAMLISPTGSGKTLMVAAIFKTLKLRVLAVSNRLEIRNQIRSCFEKEGLDYLILSNTDSAIESVMQDYDVLFIDEAHHTPARTFRRCHDLALKLGKKIVGATATPYRHDRAALDLLYPKQVGTFDSNELVRLGSLAKLTYVFADNVDFNNIRKEKRKELNKEEPFKKYMVLVTAGNLINLWKKHAKSSGAIVYCSGQKHAEIMSDDLSNQGYATALVTSRTSKIKREEAISAFESGQIKFLVNCHVFTEGTDLKNVGCVVLLRPTKSRTYYKQMIGRGMRPDVECTVIDMVGNYKLHGDVLVGDEEFMEAISTVDFSDVSNQHGDSSPANSYHLKIVDVSAEFSSYTLPELF